MHVSEGKLKPPGRKCIFLGYAIGYLVWNLDTRIIVRSRYLVFSESKMQKHSIMEVE